VLIFYKAWRRLARRLRDAETECASLRIQLSVERSRHLTREDEFVDRLLVLSGGHPFKARTIPMPEKPKVKIPDAEADSPFNAFQLAERDAWGQAAVEQGKPYSEGVKLWEQTQSGSPLPLPYEEEEAKER